MRKGEGGAHAHSSIAIQTTTRLQEAQRGGQPPPPRAQKKITKNKTEMTCQRAPQERAGLGIMNWPIVPASSTICGSGEVKPLPKDPPPSVSLPACLALPECLCCFRSAQYSHLGQGSFGLGDLGSEGIADS